ncbi:MAG: hypothetical protein JSV16_10585 [Candidatus Hydrogenedentota bacterium]|nr:MAG: hypothetical protein JSV16_10585 [Candidatus Hydrogenedentota bacterium]
MKFYGGYLPKLGGRPSSILDELPLPELLYLDLSRQGVKYTPVVREGERIGLGDTLAEAVNETGSLFLPSPAYGIVSLDGGNSGEAERIVLKTGDAFEQEGSGKRFQPHRITSEEMRDALAKGGIWPFFWSSKTKGTPGFGEFEKPRAVIVNCILTEPFRARGKVILRHAWNRIIRGISFLPRLMEDYSKMEIVLTAKNDPVAKMMHLELAGHAWIRFHTIPLAYPYEDPRILHKALLRSDPALSKDDVIWVIDVQGIEALGACLSEGLPLYRRIVAIGGPAQSNPRHVLVRIGTPLKLLVDVSVIREKDLVLRGGLLRGTPLDPVNDSVQFDDDAFFVLARGSRRDFLAFLHPGFERTSMSPCFASSLTGGADTHITASLRGERRPCISCCRCEEVCPARLMPQVLHRYIYRGALEAAESAGIGLCVECGLCSYVCPSKIELLQQVVEAKRQLREEMSEAVAAVGEG